jgi:hypothetical protein
MSRRAVAGAALSRRGTRSNGRGPVAGRPSTARRSGASSACSLRPLTQTTVRSNSIGATPGGDMPSEKRRIAVTRDRELGEALERVRAVTGTDEPEATLMRSGSWTLGSTPAIRIGNGALTPSRSRRSAGWARSVLFSGSPPATCPTGPRSCRRRVVPHGAPGAVGRSYRRAAGRRRVSRCGGSVRRSRLAEPRSSGILGGRCRRRTSRRWPGAIKANRSFDSWSPRK